MKFGIIMRSKGALALLALLFFISFINLIRITQYSSLNECPNQPIDPLSRPSQNEIMRCECDIKFSLLSSAASWKLFHQKRFKSESTSEIPHDNKFGSQVVDGKRNIWDYFLPNFNCPYGEERVGGVGDGGKWVCGMREKLEKKKDCLVYSFGVGLETSFEEEILQRTNCRLHLFDPTISSPPSFLVNFTSRATFDKMGLSGSSQNSFLTFGKALESKNETFIDVLKIDIDGGEWDALTQMLTQYPNDLPFSQLLIELHMSFLRKKKFRHVRKLWYELEKRGMRAFHAEPNMVGNDGLTYIEYAFLNLRTKDFKMESADEDFKEIEWTWKNSTYYIEKL